MPPGMQLEVWDSQRRQGNAHGIAEPNVDEPEKNASEVKDDADAKERTDRSILELTAQQVDASKTKELQGSEADLKDEELEPASC